MITYDYSTWLVRSNVGHLDYRNYPLVSQSIAKKKTICPAVSVVRISCLRRLRNQKMCQAMAMTRGLSGSLGVSRGLSGSLECIGFWQGIRLGDLVISKRVARSWLEMIMNHVLEYLNTAESS